MLSTAREGRCGERDTDAARYSSMDGIGGVRARNPPAGPASVRGSAGRGGAAARGPKQRAGGRGGGAAGARALPGRTLTCLLVGDLVEAVLEHLVEVHGLVIARRHFEQDCRDRRGVATRQTPARVRHSAASRVRGTPACGPAMAGFRVLSPAGGPGFRRNLFWRRKGFGWKLNYCKSWGGCIFMFIFQVFVNQ